MRLYAAILVAILPASALAQETAPLPQTSTGFGDAAPVDDTLLGSIAGREDTGVQVATANQRNTVSNNSVVGNSTTGSVTIDGNAFQNLQGLAVINANSGNNVAINSAMNVTINMAPNP